MKHCNACGETKPESDFGCNKVKRDGLQSQCKLCRKATNHAYYERTKPEWADRRRESKERILATNRDLVRSHLESHPCVDCGTTDWRVLEFDHVTGEKAFNIGDKLGWYKTSTIQAEIDKCEVRCANCHRIVTCERLGGWRTRDTRI